MYTSAVNQKKQELLSNKMVVPLSSTAARTAALFFLMIHEENTATILKLSSLGYFGHISKPLSNFWVSAMHQPKINAFKPLPVNLEP
jgi:hypothetical protein